MSRAPETVLFDLDDTLVRYRRSPGEVLRASFESLGLDPLFRVEAYYARFDEFAERTDSMAELRAECFAALAAENGHDPERGRAVAAAFDAERDQSNVELLPGAADALDALAGTFRLGVVTNGAADAQRRKVDSAGLERWVEAVVVAGDGVPPKPDPEPFERAMAALDATPATTVVVGDSPDTDVAGAAAAGAESVLVGDGHPTDDPATRPTYRVDRVGDVPALPWARRSAGSGE